jgi:hypothetical protein
MHYMHVYTRIKNKSNNPNTIMFFTFQSSTAQTPS